MTSKCCIHFPRDLHRLRNQHDRHIADAPRHHVRHYLLKQHQSTPTTLTRSLTTVSKYCRSHKLSKICYYIIPKKHIKRSSKTKWNNAAENEGTWTTCKISSRIIRRADKNTRCLAFCFQGQRFLELHLGFFLFVACPFDGAASRAAKPVLCAILHFTRKAVCPLQSTFLLSLWWNPRCGNWSNHILLLIHTRNVW